ncbi:MAG: hypothetical protein F4X65_08755 [Chloroflexi bacterium]|nr:hypothetical protein [Chloroflexota bacterium]
MTTVNDIADILRIIREQPEWADALRGALLSRELLEMPQRLAEFTEVANRRFAALESDVAELKSDVAELKSDVAELKSDVAELKTDVAELKRDVSEIRGDIVGIKGELNRHSGELGNLRGAEYERKIGNNINSIVAQHLGIRRVNVLKGFNAPGVMPYFDLLDDAEDRGVIDQQQRLNAGSIDFAVQGIKRPEQSTIYLALEVSITVADNDIERAEDRAHILSLATGSPTLPVVIGANIDQARHEFAAQRGVTLIAVAD